jgi:hypothetical protein
LKFCDGIAVDRSQFLITIGDTNHEHYRAGFHGPQCVLQIGAPRSWKNGKKPEGFPLPGR